MGTDFRLLRRLAVGIVAVLATMLVACSDDDALPTDPMAKSYKAEVRDGVVSLLHVSDVHGSSNGLLIIRRDIMPVSNDVVIVNTGDLESHRPKVKYPEVLSWMVSQWNVSHSDRPFLLVKGNHDACDIEFPGENGYTSGTEHQANATAHLLKPVMDGLVVWGDPSGVGGYWHKDIVTNGVKLRIIGIDEYEHSVGTPAALEGEDHSMRYSKIYSPAQIDWLENLLKNTPSDYYIVMCHHAPLYKFHPPEVLNDFVHHGIVGQFDSSFQKYYYGSMSFYRDGNIDLMARIIDAYQHRRHLSFTCVNGVAGSSLAVDVDFSGVEPATFACHLCGHTHRDYCEYHPSFPSQLCLTVGTCSPIQSPSAEDLVRDTKGVSSYLLNRVTIDTNRNVVVVERFGASELKNESWIVQDGSSRKRIEFAIRRPE